MSQYHPSRHIRVAISESRYLCRCIRVTVSELPYPSRRSRCAFRHIDESEAYPSRIFAYASRHGQNFSAQLQQSRDPHSPAWSVTRSSRRSCRCRFPICDVATSGLKEPALSFVSARGQTLFLFSQAPRGDGGDQAHSAYSRNSAGTLLKRA